MYFLRWRIRSLFVALSSSIWTYRYLWSWSLGILPRNMIKSGSTCSLIKVVIFGNHKSHHLGHGRQIQTLVNVWFLVFGSLRWFLSARKSHLLVHGHHIWTLQVVTVCILHYDSLLFIFFIFAVSPRSSLRLLLPFFSTDHFWLFCWHCSSAALLLAQCNLLFIFFLFCCPGFCFFNTTELVELQL